MRHDIRKTLWSTAAAGAVCSCALAWASGASAEATTSTFAFNIPPENAAQAFNDFSRQAGVQVLFPFDAATKVSSQGARGTFSRDEVLARLLVGTGLEIASETETVISLRVEAGQRGSASVGAGLDVIVTGTHIRGGNPTSPVHTVSRSDIDASGYSQVGDLVRSLPENFSGGQNPGVIAASATNSANHNSSNASTVNLRGLGTDATLVLLNGHRLSADSFYQGADISGIPLAALQRIEVVPDGASAFYGSDAVAGVVNFIVRRNYSGAEVSARVGTSSQGGGTEHTYSLLGGVSSYDGYLLGNYEYSRQDAIVASQRDVTADAPPTTTLLQPQTRNSLFVSAGRRFSDRVSLTFDALASERSTVGVAQYGATAPENFSYMYTPSYSAALTADIGLAGDWTLHATGVAAGSRNRFLTSIPAIAFDNAGSFKNDSQYGELTADGTLLPLPSGAVKTAFGIGHRRESFVSIGYAQGARGIDYAYAEATIPLVASDVARLGLHALDLNVSGRTERYSDFGRATSPRIGIRYVPSDDVTLRATWGRSFKAPSFLQMYGSSDLYLYPGAFFDYTGSETVLITYGGNPKLKPERSTSWTFGGDFQPARIHGLKLSATYFHIAYRDRVVEPIADLLAGLSDPAYAPFVERSPSADRQTELVSASDSFSNFTGGSYDPTSVVAVLKDVDSNATAQTAKGIDLSYRQTFAVPGAQLDAFANATWIRLDQQTISTSPSLRLSGTIFNVPDVKARAGVTWTRRGWSATGIVNYVSSELDTGIMPSVRIASWTTADATLAYRFGDRSSGLQGVRLVLSASNLFDRAPPRAVSPGQSYPQGIQFDSTNSSVIGRFVSLTVAKAW